MHLIDMTWYLITTTCFCTFSKLRILLVYCSTYIYSVDSIACLLHTYRMPKEYSDELLFFIANSKTSLFPFK